MQPWECDGVISCGKVVLRPGDAIIGDQDGVVCVPASHAQQVYDIAHGREVIEGVIKEELVKSTHDARSEHTSRAGAALDAHLNFTLLTFFCMRAQTPARPAAIIPSSRQLSPSRPWASS